jgi:hypothetical protein
MNKNTRKNNKKGLRKTSSKRQIGGDTNRLFSIISNQMNELDNFKKEKQALLDKKKINEKEVTSARLVTENAKRGDGPDGEDLVTRAKRDIASLVTPFLRMTQDELDEYNNEIEYLNVQIKDTNDYIIDLGTRYFNEKFIEGVEEGDENTVKELLKSGIAGIDVNTRSGNTPILVIAVHKGHLNIVKLLLQQPDIDVNVQHHGNGATPLITALRSLRAGNHHTVEIIKLLLKDKRTDVSINTVYSTALDAAMHNNAPPEIIDLIEKREQEDRLNKHLVTHSSRVADRTKLSKLKKKMNLPCEMYNTIQDHLGGKSKRKTRKKHRKKK